jgi:flavin reductase (DIM6/NTAB) family NADH-FMN oxidoreductase RutF
MYREISHMEFSKELFEQLKKGAFLTVKQGEKINTMTISCGSMGFLWTKPMFTVMVRYSRYTHELIKNANSFTVSFPLSGQLKNELNICGTKSGKDTNKIDECKFTLKEGSLANTVIIDECDLHLECKIVYKQPVDKNMICKKIRECIYSNEDYHVLYFGEIIKAYMKQ